MSTPTLDENGIPAAGLPRARDLIANYLWNEDGESEEWLHEAHDILQDVTALGASPPPPDLSELLQAARDVVVQRGRYYRDGVEDPVFSVVPRSALRALDSALVHFRATLATTGEPRDG